jgi:hypothetical protein
MKSIKISKIKEVKPKENIVEQVAKQMESPQKFDNSFEQLFYNAVNVFAYSRFCEVSLSSQEFSDAEIVVKNLYKNFVEKRGFFDEHELKTYQNLVTIIDDGCVEKIQQFITIISNNEEDSITDKKIHEFVNYQDKIIEVVSDECKKEENNKKIEYLMKALCKRNPQKFQELIDFEINKKELKDSNDKIRLVLGDKILKPSTVILNEIKKHSNLEKTSLKKANHDSVCIVS